MTKRKQPKFPHQDQIPKFQVLKFRKVQKSSFDDQKANCADATVQVEERRVPLALPVLLSDCRKVQFDAILFTAMAESLARIDGVFKC
jgi:hypothetical protein